MGHNKKSNDIRTKALTQKAFLSFYKSNRCNISKACELTKIARSTVFTWRNEEPQFAKAMEDVYEGLIDKAEEQLTVNIEQGKETSLIFYLANKGKTRGWQSINKAEISGALRIDPIVVVPVVSAPPPLPPLDGSSSPSQSSAQEVRK